MNPDTERLHSTLNNLFKSYKQGCIQQSFAQHCLTCGAKSFNLVKTCHIDQEFYGAGLALPIWTIY